MSGQSASNLSLSVNGQTISGWTSVRLTRRLDGIPSDFEVELTERYPGQATLAVVEAGNPCKVYLGDDLVITGYVDRYSSRIAARNHTVRIMGRGKTEDLVDCSVTPDQINGMQITTSSLVDLAQTLSRPFGIQVNSMTGTDVPVSSASGPLIVSAMITESPWEIIEQVARYAGVLVYEDGTGALVIANVGTGSMASGFKQGVNAQVAACTYSMDQRFSVYYAYLMATNTYGSEGAGGASLGVATDPGVPRYRPKVIVSEQFDQNGDSFAARRIQWEAARRAGRSQAVQIVCDSWRDSAGELWQPNYFAPVSAPAIKVTPSEPWIIGEVTYLVTPGRDGGTTAQLTLMPKEAFQPEPTLIMPNQFQALAQGGAAAAPNPQPPNSAPPPILPGFGGAS